MTSLEDEVVARDLALLPLGVPDLPPVLAVVQHGHLLALGQLKLVGLLRCKLRLRPRQLGRSVH